MKSDAVALIRALGTGQSAESLGLGRTEEGLVDLRAIRIPQAKAASGTILGADIVVGNQTEKFRGVVEFVPDRVVFEGLTLEVMDFSKAAVGDAVWRDCRLKHVRFDKARLRETVFRSGLMTETSFRGANLRDTHWGTQAHAGPDVLGSDFSEADLRGSTFGYPLFRNCRFSHTNLRSVDFFGARFEGCTFEGLLEEVLFHGRWLPEGPEVQNLRNSMKDVDLSRADLRWVEFDMGINLTSCKLPAEGYLRVPHPRAAFTSALRQVEREWTGEARTAGTFFLENILKHHPEEQPFTILRPRDFIESPMGPEIAAKLVSVIQEVSREGTSAGSRG